MSMIDQGGGSGAAATAYTDSFFDVAVAKIDATFGKGFAKANPSLIGALVQASTANLSAFMQAAAAFPPDYYDMDDEEEEEDDPLPPLLPPRSGKGRR